MNAKDNPSAEQIELQLSKCILRHNSLRCIAETLTKGCVKYCPYCCVPCNNLNHAHYKVYDPFSDTKSKSQQ